MEAGAERAALLESAQFEHDCSLVLSNNLHTDVDITAGNEPSRRLKCPNNEEGPYEGLLVQSSY